MAIAKHVDIEKSETSLDDSAMVNWLQRIERLKAGITRAGLIVPTRKNGAKTSE